LRWLEDKFKSSIFATLDRFVSRVGRRVQFYIGRRVAYSATDLLPAAQQILRKHRAGFLHLFVNVLDRLAKPDRDLLEGIVNDHMARYSQHVLEHESQQITASDLQGFRHSLGLSLKQQLSDHLETVEFNEKAHCLVHGHDCYLSPRFDKSLVDVLWVEAAGNTCCPWSSMNTSGSMWLDHATLPFLVAQR
jgi:hypothetical protein